MKIRELLSFAALVLATIAQAPSSRTHAQSFTFAVTCDMRYYSGTDYDASQYFRGAVEAIDALGQGDFMISPGDIDPLEDVYWTITAVLGQDYVWYPAVGNHELPGNGHEDREGDNMKWLNRYDYGDVNPGPAGSPVTTYSFDYENAHFTVLNEYSDVDGDDVTSGDIPDHLYDWLEADLQATEKTHVFVIGHEPAYPQPDADNGRVRHLGDSLDQYPATRDRFWRLLKDQGVRAYICGHTHNYSTVMLDGVWQVDAGHARGRGDTGARSTFLMVHVDGGTVAVDAYRDSYGNGPYALTDTVTLTGIYTVHLGIDPDTGDDVFPQETAEDAHLTGAASALMTLRHLSPGYSESQSYLHNLYHLGRAGTDMSADELKTALDSEAGAPYRFAALRDSDQLEAIKRFVHWIDYAPAGALHTPAVAVSGDDCKSTVVRGFVTDVGPSDPDGVFVIPDYTLYGLWVNDPAIAGLGFDVYQVPATFQALYRPADGLYHSVVEPPEEHLRDLADYLAKVRLTLGKGRTNPHLRTLISGGRDGREKTVRRRKGMDTGSRVRACLKAGLPAGLKNDRAFMDMFDDAGRVAQFDVSPADELGSEPRGYVLHAFYRSATDSATILIETDPEDGSFSQATWLDEGETYPRVSRREAVRTAR